MKSGIYKIINDINGKYYVGSAKNLTQRKNEHFGCLRKNKHINKYLQRAWNKYGEGAFHFEIVEEVICENLPVVEQRYLDVASKDVSSYNIAVSATLPMLGRTHSKESRNKTRQTLLGHSVSEETREKIRQSIAGRNFIDSETRSKTAKPDGHLKLVDKKGNIYEIKCGYRVFAKEHDLDSRTLQRVLTKKPGYNSIKGFSIFQEK